MRGTKRCTRQGPGVVRAPENGRLVKRKRGWRKSENGWPNKRASDSINQSENLLAPMWVNQSVPIVTGRGRCASSGSSGERESKKKKKNFFCIFFF